VIRNAKGVGSVHRIAATPIGLLAYLGGWSNSGDFEGCGHGVHEKV
jgi:hypothetical protein